MVSAESVDGLSRSAPELEGIDAKDIHEFLDDAARLGVELNSMMLYRGGHVVAEGWWWPYRPELRHMMHSATKSFLSVAVGLAISEGYFGLGDRVISFFPDHAPVTEPTSNLALMTVEDLLTQMSGHGKGTSGNGWRSITTSWIAEFFAIPAVHKPGSRFVYTSATSFMLSAIVSKTTGQNAHEFLDSRLFQPLGMDDLTWDVGPENINPGGNGISCRTSDLLKLAILHLQKGVWQGRQIVPEEWAVNATSAKRGNDHGYHWWTRADGTFYAYGVFGQFAFVSPEHDGILVLTSAVPAKETELRALAWRHFPKIFRPRTNEPLQHDATLDKRVDSLRVLDPLQPASSPLSRQISGKTFTAESNKDNIQTFGLTFTADNDRCTFRLQDHRGHHTVECGLLDWIEGMTTVTGAPLHHGYQPAEMRVVAGGRWTAPDTFEMTWQFSETSFRDKVTVRFSEDHTKAMLDRSVNVNTLGLSRPTVVGGLVERGML